MDISQLKQTCWVPYFFCKIVLCCDTAEARLLFTLSKYCLGLVLHNGVNLLAKVFSFHVMVFWGGW